MEQYILQYSKMDNFDALEGKIDKENIVLCDDIQNTFIVIAYDDVHRIGIAYYNYGIKPAYMYSEDCKYLYLGFGKKMICIDLNKNRITERESLSSIFYELISDSRRNYVCVVCELDLYCYQGNTNLWKIGFKDVIEEYQMVDDSKISIKCSDGTDYLFQLKNGELIE